MIRLIPQYSVAFNRKDNGALIDCLVVFLGELASMESKAEDYADELGTEIIVTATSMTIVESFKPRKKD